MSFSSNFLSLLIDTNCDLSIKSKYLDEARHFNHFNSLDDKQLESIKQKINSSLALHNKRLEGFILLNKYLDECLHCLVLNESVSWATSCLQSSTCKNTLEKQLSFICLKKIFHAASDSPEIYRMLSGTIVPQFIDLLPQMRIDSCDSKIIQEFSLCFEICLRVFKGPCGSRRKLIEDFILGLSNSPNFVWLAKSFATLAFTASNNQLLKNNGFNDFMIMCVYSLDTLFDSNLNQTHQLQYYSSIKEKPFLALDNGASKMERTLDFLNKFKFLCSVVGHLLDESFDGLVKIPIVLILNLIQRAVSLKINRNQTTANLESILNSNIIPSIYTNALTMLNQLITTCSTNLSINLKETNKILLDLLENLDPNEKNYLIEIKSQWYNVVCNWFDKLGNHLTVIVRKQWEDLMIDNFFNDIQVKRNSLELQNKKQLQNGKSASNKFTDNSQFSFEELQLCSQTCKTMNSFLIHFSRSINPKKFHKFIYQLLKLVQDLYRIDLWRKSTYFIDPGLRLSLLKIFRTCLISFMNTSLLNNATILLNTILKLDKSSSIQLFAKATLMILNSSRNKIYYSTQDASELNLINGQVNEQTTEKFTELMNDKPNDKPNDEINEQSFDKEDESFASISSNPNNLSDNSSAQNKFLSDVSSIDTVGQFMEFIRVPEIDNLEPISRLSPKKLTQFIRNETLKVSSHHKIADFALKVFDETISEKSTMNGEQSKEKAIDVLTNNELTNKEKLSTIAEDNGKNVQDKIVADKESTRRSTRSKIISSSEEMSLPVSTRLTRSVKKKLQENELQSTNQKKQKTQETVQNENLIQKQTIDENENDPEVEEILKEFVDA